MNTFATEEVSTIRGPVEIRWGIINFDMFSPCHLTDGTGYALVQFGARLFRTITLYIRKPVVMTKHML